jgi:hypothetical protein
MPGLAFLMKSTRLLLMVRVASSVLVAVLESDGIEKLACPLYLLANRPFSKRSVTSESTLCPKSLGRGKAESISRSLGKMGLSLRSMRGAASHGGDGSITGRMGLWTGKGGFVAPLCSKTPKRAPMKMVASRPADEGPKFTLMTRGP